MTLREESKSLQLGEERASSRTLTPRSVSEPAMATATSFYLSVSLSFDSLSLFSLLSTYSLSLFNFFVLFYRPRGDSLPSHSSLPRSSALSQSVRQPIPRVASLLSLSFSSGFSASLKPVGRVFER